MLLAKVGVDTAENEPLEITDSAAGENTEMVVSRILKTDLVGVEAREKQLTIGLYKKHRTLARFRGKECFKESKEGPVLHHR